MDPDEAGLDDVIGEERDQLREVLQGIDTDLGWFVRAHGAVSRDDLVNMVRAALKRIDAARDLIYPV